MSDINSEATDALYKADSDAIHKIYMGSFLATLKKSDIDSEVVDLFNFDYMKGNRKPEGGYESLSDDQIIAYNELVIVHNVLDSVAKDKASLNSRQLEQNNHYKIEDAFEIYHQAGFDAAYVEKNVLGLPRQNPTITAHPTGDLNEQRSFDLSTPEGVFDMVDRILSPLSQRKLSSVTYQPDMPASSENRDENERAKQAFDTRGYKKAEQGTSFLLDEHTTAVDKKLYLLETNNIEQAEKIIESMMGGNMSPSRRLNTFEELINAFSYSVRDRIATGNMLENIYQTSRGVFGAEEHSHPINPADDNFNFAALLASWVDDTDGKPNAEHIALLAFQSLNIMVASSYHLENLEMIKEIEPSIAQDKHFRNLSNAFSEIPNRLTPLISQTATLYNRVHDTSLTAEERGRRYIEAQEEFEKLNDQIGQVLDNIEFDGRSLNQHGVELFSRVERFYRHLTDKLDGSAAQVYSRQSASLIHKNGLGMMKSEARTGRPVVNQTANSLLTNPEFITYLQNETDMPQDLRETLENLDGALPSDLDFKTLDRITSAISREVKPEKLLEFLEKSNPLEPSDEHGYPNQNYAFVQRTKVKAKFGLMHGAFITAEADHNSSVLTRLILDAQGRKLENSAIINLREDLDIMTDSTAGVALNIDNMRNAQIKRAEQDSRIRHQSQPEVQMWAQSDSQKALGPLSSLMIARQVQKDTEFVLDHWYKDGAKDGDVLPLLQKIGNGLDPQRGGGDPMVWPRLIAQTMQNYMCKNDIDPDDLPDKFISMAMNLDHTRQGRDTYKTSADIQLEREQQIAEMMMIHAEIKGIVKEGTAIPQTKPFSDNMAKFLDEMIDLGMDRYRQTRTARIEPEDELSVLDVLMDKACPRDITGKSNSAARMAAKGGAGAKGHTQGRAIGSRNENATEGSHRDAYYSEGFFMQALHQALHQGYTLQSGEKIKLGQDDVEDLKNNGFWDYQLTSRTLMDTVQTDFEHSFRELGMDDKTVWTSDKLHNVAKSTVFKKADEKDKDGGDIFLIDCPHDVLPEQALQAVYYADFRNYTMGLNALNDDSFVNNSNLYSKNPKAITMTADFNEQVTAKYPFIHSIRERSTKMQPALDHLIEHGKLPGTSEKADRSAASAWRTGYDTPKRELVGDGYQFAFGRRIAPLNIEDCISEKYGGENYSHIVKSGMVGSEPV